MTSSTPAIRDLAVIGDCRTAAIVGRDGAIVWYCPGRFDRPSLLAALLDPQGGAWSVQLPGAAPGSRRYIDDSGVLETRLRASRGDLAVIDWMPVGRGLPEGLLCRRFSAAPEDTRVVIEPRPDYARRKPELTPESGAWVIDGAHSLHASHPLTREDDAIVFTLPQGEEGWAVLASGPHGAPSRGDLDRWLAATLWHWRRMSAENAYSGPYEREVAQSLRAIRLLTHEETGGIVAAATTSLPEVAGGSRNWDYRYVWLRDAGMIVSALTRMNGDTTEGGRYLDFICRARGSSSSYPVAVMMTLDYDAAPGEENLDLAGHEGSRPVRIGNGARDQLQLDAYGNVVLAAKLIYSRSRQRPHWHSVEEIADFLVGHWQEPDHGIWEEPERRQYTASKVIAACALDSAAEYSSEPKQAARWRKAAADIRAFVANECLTVDGAYAAIAGRDQVDVSAALFPVWAYTEAGAPEMVATIAALEKHWSWQGLLYWRRLECDDTRQEGAFLPGTLWVAQYWIMRGDLARARRIIDAVLECSTDLGLLSEEADPHGRRLLGNIPQAFAHAAFIGAVVDLKAASGGTA